MTPGEWTPAPTPRELEERMTETVRQKLVNVCPGNPTPLSEEIAAAALAVVREELAEPTPEMILAGHRQIDWCRDSQNTYLPEHPSQHPEGVGSSCGEDVADAFRAMLAASPLRAAP